MFAYYFPPHGGGGVLRTLKYVKYLPRHGFDPIVVTATPRAYPLRDETLLSEVPDGTVIARARTVPLQQARWKLEGMLRRVGLPTTLAAQIGWPDPQVGWLPAAVFHGLRLSRERRPAVLYSTSSPTTAHLAALIVHGRTGIPWVADFRDGWTLNPQGDPLWPLLARLSSELERRVLADVSAAIVADESVHLLGLPQSHPRAHIIPNGVDPDDLPPVPTMPAEPGTSRFRLSYVGSLYGTRDAAPVFAAARAILERDGLSSSEFELRIIGDASASVPYAEGLPVTRIGHLNHHRALAEMSAASALLFYAPPENRGTSGKIYEYLAVGRPILCVATADNLATQLVQELDAGECADPRRPEEVREALERLIARWRQGSLNTDESVRETALRRYSRPALAGQLARVLQEATRTT